MAYAIIKSGGKQIKVVAGESIIIEKIDADKEVRFDQVLAVHDGKKLHIGKPLVKGSEVVGEVQKHGKAKKIKILRTKAKSN
jgi:large subunit ribosomal protein L21